MSGISNRDKARKLYNAGKYYDAIPKFRKAVTSGELGSNDLYDDCIRLAVCYYRTNNNNSALFYLKEALRWRTDDYFAYYWFSEVYLDNKEYELAYKYVTEALDRYDDAFCWHVMAKILKEVEDIDDAEDAARKAIDIAITKHPNSVKAFRNTLTEILTKKEELKRSKLVADVIELTEKKEFTTAISKCKDMLSSGDFNGESLIKIHNTLGDCYSKTKQYLSAISEYNIALNIASNPELNLASYIGLTLSYIDIGRLDEAINSGNKALPLMTNLLSDLRSLETEESNVESTITELNESIKDFTTMLDILPLLRDKKYEELLTKYINDSASSQDISEFITIPICHSLVKVRKFDKLLDYVSSQIDNDDGFLDAYRGIAHYHQKHYETALQCINRGINAGEDDNADVWGYKGECHFLFKEYDKAIEAYQKALDTKHPLYDEFDETYLGDKIRISKEKLAQEKSKVIPSHITIQGNSAPISFGGIIATDDAVINRSNVSDSSEIGVLSNFCPQCGAKVDAGDMFCRKCGRKLT